MMGLGGGSGCSNIGRRRNEDVKFAGYDVSFSRSSKVDMYVFYNIGVLSYFSDHFSDSKKDVTVLLPSNDDCFFMHVLGASVCVFKGKCSTNNVYMSIAHRDVGARSRARNKLESFFK
jgi:hypothetical protein